MLYLKSRYGSAISSLGLIGLIFLCLHCIGAVDAYAEEKILNGRITNAETGEALPVAHIRIEGTRSGTISNNDGDYSLTVPDLPATLIVSYIGYKSTKITVDETTALPLDIALAPSPVMIETVTVYPEDEARRIMRNVIENKKKWRPRLETYTVDAYTRLNLANDKQIVSMVESVSDVYWDRDQGLKEITRSKRQSVNIKTTENIAMAHMTPNLYDDNIDILDYDCIGPTHPDALDHYQFRITEKRFMDDAAVYVISVTPKSRLQPLFVGTIAVLDSVYAMIEADLEPSEAVMLPPPLNYYRFVISQKFSTFGGDFWLPVDVHSRGEIKIKLPGIEFPMMKIEQLTRFGEYKINVPMPDSLFKKRTMITITASPGSVSATVANENLPTATAKRDSISASSARDKGRGAEKETIADDNAAGVKEKTAVSHDTAVTESRQSSPSQIAVSEAADSSAARISIPVVSKADSIAAAHEDSLRAIARIDSIFSASANVIPFTDEEQIAYAKIDSSLTLDRAFKPKGLLVRIAGDGDDEKKRSEHREPGPVGKFMKRLGHIEPNLRYNRVEAFYGGLAWEKPVHKHLTLSLNGGYGTGTERWSYGGGLSSVWGGHGEWTASVHASTSAVPRQTGASAQADGNLPPVIGMVYPAWLTSILALSGRQEYYDWYRADKTELSLGRSFAKNRIRLAGGVGFEHHESLEKTTDRTITGKKYDQPPNIPIDDGELRSVKFSFRYGDAYSPISLAPRKGVTIAVEHSSPAVFKSDFTFSRIDLDAGWRFETFLKRRMFPNTLDLRLIGGTTTGKAPIQRFGLINGVMGMFTPFGVFRSMRDRPLEGEHYCALFAEHNFRTVPFELIGLRGIARKGVGIIVHGGAGRTWISADRKAGILQPLSYRDKPTSEIGLSLNGLFTLFRVDVTKRLDSHGIVVGAWLARYI